MSFSTTGNGRPDEAARGTGTASREAGPWASAKLTTAAAAIVRTMHSMLTIKKVTIGCNWALHGCSDCDSLPRNLGFQKLIEGGKAMKLSGVACAILLLAASAVAQTTSATIVGDV